MRYIPYDIKDIPLALEMALGKKYKKEDAYKALTVWYKECYRVAFDIINMFKRITMLNTATSKNNMHWFATSIIECRKLAKKILIYRNKNLSI